MITLYHGSPIDCGDTLTAQRADAKPNFIFDGLFCNTNIIAAESHGDFIYKTEIRSQDILENMFFFNHDNCDKIDKALAKVVQISEDNYDIWFDALCLGQYDMYDERWLEMLSVSDPDSVGWELQNLRGRLAAALGFKAAEMQDEHGTSYLVLPGNTLSRLDQKKETLMYTINHNNYEEHLDNLLNALDSCNFLDAIALVRECEAKGLVIYPDDNGIDIYDGEDPINENTWQDLLDNLHKYYAARR